ncbi:T9SS type A sorting domain-containing protein [Fulvivirga kasyanovii]|nr:serine hydrolase [Fulvivirga kasyanovii]
MKDLTPARLTPAVLTQSMKPCWTHVEGLMLLAIFLISLFFPGNPAIAQTDCRLEISMNGYMGANSTGGVYGYYLQERGGKTIASRNENYAFYPASTMKVFLHTYAIRNYSLNDLTFAYSFNESCDDDHTGSTPVATRSLQNALPIMMVNSGNSTTNAIMELIGDGSASVGRNRVNSMLANNFGISGQTKVNHKLGCDGPNNNPANIATAKDFARFYDRVMNWNYLTDQQRITFSNLMINETTTGTVNNPSLSDLVSTEVDNLIAQYNMSNISSDQIQDFKDQIRLVHKAGNIGTAYISNAGWISLPFKDSGTGNVINKEYSYCIFYDQITNFTSGARLTTLELLRNEILAALQTWNTKGIFVLSKASYTTEKVGELISPELGTTDDAVSIVSVNTTQAVTAIRDINGKLKLISWSVAYDGTSIARQKSYTTGTYITAVKAVTLSNGRLVTAVRQTNGNLQIRYWRVDNAGNFTLKDIEYAGEVGDLDLVKITSNRIATPVSTSGRDLKVIIWDVEQTEQINREGDGTVADADIVAGASVLSSMRLVTATKNNQTGNLEVQYWSVSYSGGLTLKSTASAGTVDDVSMAGLSYSQFVTNVIQDNTIQKSIVWEICPDGSLTRKGDDAYVGIRDIASEQLKIGQRQVVVAKDNNNKFNMSMWDVGSEGKIMRTGTYLSETIGQAEVAVMNSSTQLVITAYTTSSDYLKLRTWSMNDLIVISLGRGNMANEDDGTSPVEFTDIEQLEEGQVLTNNISELEDNAAVEATMLQQNYPNPFKDETIINYSLKESGQVKLTVLDFKGNEILTLISDKKEAGHHSFTLSGQDLPQGIYFYRLQAGNDTVIKKMIHK